MAVVKDYYIGNTRIIICDDAYRDKTPEELDRLRHFTFMGRHCELVKVGEEGKERKEVMA